MRSFLGGILLQSGGFFVHMLVGQEQRASAGTWMAQVLLSTGSMRPGQPTSPSLHEPTSSQKVH